MSCEYCEEREVLLTKEIPFAGFSNEVIGHFPLGVFIDRGYLRLVDLEDYQCMDHGEKIKINYCPNCGENLKE